MRHTHDDYAEWGLPLGTVRQVYAIDTSTPARPVVFLAPGGSDRELPGDEGLGTVRSRTRAGHFHCLVGRLRAVHHTAAGQKRDHWVHGDNRARTDPNHQGESLWHHQVKHRFASWIRQRHRENQLGPIAMLRIDDYLIPTPGGDLKPDVYVEFVNGLKIAIEIQHSAGDPVRVPHKRQSYRLAGIVDWWIYGSLKQTCRLQPRPGPWRKVLPVPSQAEMIATGQRFYWFNYRTDEIGTPYSFHRSWITQHPEEDWTGVERPLLHDRPLPHAQQREVYLAAEALDRCRITADGQLSSPTDRTIERAAQRAAALTPRLRDQARANHQHRQAEARERARQARRIEAVAAATRRGRLQVWLARQRADEVLTALAARNESVQVRSATTPTPPQHDDESPATLPAQADAKSPAQNAATDERRLPRWRRWLRRTGRAAQPDRS